MSSLVSAQTGPSCDTVPTIDSPGELFAFGPISSTQTASFTFFMASNVTLPQGMQSQYASKISSGSTVSLTTDFWWMGTIGIHNQLVAYTSGASTALCTWSLVRLFKQVRNGILKHELHDNLIEESFFPNRVSANTAFDFYLYGDDSEDYNNLLTVKNYKIEVEFNANRACDNATHKLNLGDHTSATLVNATALKWSVGTTLDAGIYSVCLRLTNSAGNTSDWFPLSAANGHYRHNLDVGSSSTTPNTFWNAIINPTYGSIIFGIASGYFTETTILSSQYSYFSVDATLDVCNPMTTQAFGLAEIAPWNGTHKLMTMTVAWPSQKPGGGWGVICGAAEVNGPWMLVTKNAMPVRKCKTTERYLDNACSNPDACSCNGAGACPKGETIDWTVASRNCICNDGFYGTNCEYADIPPPNSSLANLTVVRRRTVVAFTTPDSSWDVYMNWTDNGTIVNCTHICYAYLPLLPRHADPVNFTVLLWSHAPNGSETSASRRPTYIFTVEPPTLSATDGSHSMSESHSLSRSPSITDTETETRTPPPTPTKTFTPTKTVPPTPTHEPTATRSPQTADPATCAAALNETPPVIQAPTQNLQYLLNESMRCGQCYDLACSYGFAGSCNGHDAFWINISYVSLFPNPHCNVTFFDPVNETYFNVSMGITIRPAVLIASSVWLAPAGSYYSNGTSRAFLRGKTFISLGLVNYSVSNVPYNVNKTSIQVRVCSANSSTNSTWQDMDLRDGSATVAADKLTRIDLPAVSSSLLCLEIQIMSPAMETARYIVTISYTQVGDSSNLFGFLKGDIAPLLSDVAEGVYLPAQSAADPARVRVEVSSAFAEEPSVAPDGITDISQFNGATFAVIAVSLLGGGAIAYIVYQWQRPKPIDHVKGIVNAMLTPDQRLAQVDDWQ